MRKQYYTLRDMYRLKGGFLKKSPHLVEIFHDQKQIFDKYLCVPDYSFLWECKYYGVFTNLAGQPIDPTYSDYDGDIDKIIQGLINKHYNGRQIEYSARTMLTEMKLPKLDMTVLTAGLQKELEEVEESLGRHRSHIIEAEQSIADRYVSVKLDMDKLARIHADIDAKGDDEHARLECERINKSIASVTRTGFWHYAFHEQGKYDNKYVFVSEDVEMTDPEGVTVNFGQFMLELNMNPDTFVVRMKLYKFRNNFSASGFYHCNVSSWGDICWGNMSTKVHDMLAHYDVSGAVDTLNTILTKYTPTSPYMRFNTFRLRDNKGIRSDKHPDTLAFITAFLPYKFDLDSINVQTMEYLFPDSWPEYLKQNTTTEEEVSDE
jgi:hypothetical protein